MDASESTSHSTASGGAVVLMREAWVKRIAAFVATAGTPEEARLEGRPEIVFSKIDQTVLGAHYSDFNVRSRHFRCLETFLVEVDEAEQITALVAVDGLTSAKRILNVNLVVAMPSEQPIADRLRALLDGALEVCRRFTPIAKLRLLYIFDHSFSAPLGAHVAPLLIDGFEAAGLVEEARIANETGPGREAVLLGFFAREGVDAGA